MERNLEVEIPSVSDPLRIEEGRSTLLGLEDPNDNHYPHIKGPKEGSRNVQKRRLAKT